MAHVGLLEDNSRIAKLCATMLQYAGYQVIIYEHPQACLDSLLPTMQNQADGVSVILPPVDVLILDLHLPDITGLDVLYSLCSHPSTQSLPLIFCTAATPAEVALALRLAPHASFLEKPFNYHDLISVIRKSLSDV
jgi:CheY-like chemotaxis protein